MWLDTDASSPNLGAGWGASPPNSGLGVLAPRTHLCLVVDASKSNSCLGVVVSNPIGGGRGRTQTFNYNTNKNNYNINNTIFNINNFNHNKNKNNYNTNNTICQYLYARWRLGLPLALEPPKRQVALEFSQASRSTGDAIANRAFCQDPRVGGAKFCPANWSCSSTGWRSPYPVQRSGIRSANARCPLSMTYSPAKIYAGNFLPSHPFNAKFIPVKKKKNNPISSLLPSQPFVLRAELPLNSRAEPGIVFVLGY